MTGTEKAKDFDGLLAGNMVMVYRKKRGPPKGLGALTLARMGRVGAFLGKGPSRLGGLGLMGLAGYAYAHKNKSPFGPKKSFQSTLPWNTRTDHVNSNPALQGSMSVARGGGKEHHSIKQKRGGDGRFVPLSPDWGPSLNPQASSPHPGKGRLIKGRRSAPPPPPGGFRPGNTYTAIPMARPSNRGLGRFTKVLLGAGGAYGAYRATRKRKQPATPRRSSAYGSGSGRKVKKKKGQYRRETKPWYSGRVGLRNALGKMYKTAGLYRAGKNLWNSVHGRPQSKPWRYPNLWDTVGDFAYRASGY